MRLVAQRVREARVTVERETVATVGEGLAVLVGFGREDDAALPTRAVWSTLLDKLVHMRVFPALEQPTKLDRSLTDVGGELLLVSQFTLYADCRRGRRPSFTPAAPPETAAPLFSQFVEDARTRLPGKVAQGVFAASMELSLTNWGPLTIILDSEAFA